MDGGPPPRRGERVSDRLETQVAAAPQTGGREGLGVINSSADDPRKGKAMRLCDVRFGILWRRAGDYLSPDWRDQDR
jgi:hypothetical protein